MHERIRKLRRILDLTQEKFAERIGVKRNTIATYESGRNNPVDSVVSLICREFNVNEHWLRTGEGEMFNPAPSSELDTLAKRYGLSHGAYVLIEKFINLRKEDQNVIVDFIREVADGFGDADPVLSAWADIDIEAEVQNYRDALIQQKKAADGSSASNGTEGTGDRKDDQAI